MNKEDCFVIGNGESRNIFGDLMRLKGKGTVYGCNAIYRDYPLLCDKIFAANQSMYEEVLEGKKNKNVPAEIIGPEILNQYSYKVEGDKPYPMPKGLKIYRVWKGGDNKRKKTRTIDLSTARGSGMSAVYHAAEQGFKNIFIIAFDILGARQWETIGGTASRIQNNIYKDSPNYPTRMNMKAYLKYEWLYQLTQMTRKFPETNFLFINRKEYIKLNWLLPYYIDYSKNNFRAYSYAELNKHIESNPGVQNLKYILPRS